MPELPEVETTKRGISPYLLDQTVRSLTVFQSSLRWPVPAQLPQLLQGKRVVGVARRAKYLLIEFEHGTLLIHLGMSGSLRLTDPEVPRRKHDHVELITDQGWALRYCDPRRFGCWLWSDGEHVQLSNLGPEPLGSDFDGELLWHKSRGKRVAVKPFIMNNAVVVGVGNIYATEALFNAGIRPDRAAGSISKIRYCRLAEQIKSVLQAAIDQGGTTLRDFVSGHGEPGYFEQELQLYGRKAQPCPKCGTGLKEVKLGQRSSVYCRVCQR